MPEPVAPKRKYTRKAAEPTPVPRTRGQALPPEVRNKVWNDRMVLGMTVNATATKNGVSPSYVKNVTLGHADSGPGWRSKTAMVGPVPYRQLKPEAKKAWNDLGYFATRYFGAILMPAHIEACMRFMAAMDTDEKEYIVANMPPGFGKSLCFTRIFPAWLIVRNRAIRMMIVSNTQRNAERYTDSLRRALEQPLPVRASDNDLRLGIAVDAQSSLLKDFGVFKAPNADSGQIWSRKEFQVMQHLGQPVAEKEPTCSAFGMGGQFLGNRLNVVIGDDVYDKSANRTAETRDYFKTWFDANVETRLEPNGLLALVGQRQHADDIYKHCISKRDSLDDAGEEIEDTAEHTKMYQHLTYRAHYDELCTGHHDNLPPYPESCLLYPNRLKWRDLRKVMTNNPSIFAVEYQQEDMAKGDTLVDKLWVYGGVDPDTGVHYQGVMDRDRGEWELPKGLGWTFNYVTVDPSPTLYWSCVTKSASVQVLGGVERLDTIVPGDMVATRDGYRTVLESGSRGFKSTVVVTLTDGRSLTLTPDHRVAVPGGWSQAGDLRPGDALVVAPADAAAALGSFPDGVLSPQVAPLAGDATVGAPASAAVTGGLARLAVPVSVGVPVDVVARQFVQSGAAVGTEVLPSTPCLVLSSGLHDEVIRVDAPGVVAQVAGLVPERYYTFSPMQDDPVDQGVSWEGSQTSDGVSLPVRSSRPLPASGLGFDGTCTQPVEIKEHAGSSVSSASSGLGSPVALATPGGVPADRLPTIPTSIGHVISVTEGPTVETWDLTVEGCPEFIANGIVVHNCQFWAYHPETEQRFMIAHIRKKMMASELLDFNLDSGTFSGIMEEWQLRAKAWGRPIQYWIIEQNAAQRFMLQYDWMKKWQVIRGAQVVAHDTNRNKSDPQYGVQSLASLFKQGKLRLPWRSMDPGRVGTLKLIEEALVWPQGSTDDAIMSLWFGEWNLPRLFAPVTAATPVFHVPSWVSRGLEDNAPVPLMARLRSVS